MAGKTPHGARPNRGTTSVDARVLRAKADERTARPKFPGRSLDPVSNAGARGMIVSRKGTEFGLRPTAALYPMSQYLVTGGAGFIGSHLTEELIRRGERVRVVDSLITGKRRNLDHVAGVEFLAGDLADAGVARHAVEGVEYVLHQAAIPSVPRSVREPL